MSLSIFTVYDSKAEAYLTPFFAPTPAVALRMFENAAQDDQHEFHRFAGDYTLFQIGHFDQDDGLVFPTESNKNLGNALQFAARKEAETIFAGARRQPWNGAETRETTPLVETPPNG